MSITLLSSTSCVDLCAKKDALIFPSYTWIYNTYLPASHLLSIVAKMSTCQRCYLRAQKKKKSVSRVPWRCVKFLLRPMQHGHYGSVCQGKLVFEKRGNGQDGTGRDETTPATSLLRNFISNHIITHVNGSRICLITKSGSQGNPTHTLPRRGLKGINKTKAPSPSNPILNGSLKFVKYYIMRTSCGILVGTILNLLQIESV